MRPLWRDLILKSTWTKNPPLVTTSLGTVVAYFSDQVSRCNILNIPPCSNDSSSCS